MGGWEAVGMVRRRGGGEWEAVGVVRRRGGGNCKKTGRLAAAGGDMRPAKECHFFFAGFLAGFADFAGAAFFAFFPISYCAAARRAIGTR